MNYFVHLIIEAICVGVSVVLIGTMLSFGVSKFYPKPFLPKICSSYNKYHVMEFTLFFTGFLVHILFEAVGANYWYLSNAAAKKVKGK